MISLGVIAGDHEGVRYHRRRPVRMVRSAKDHNEREMPRDEGVHWIQPRLINCEGFDCFDEEARR